ncbi:hypothetical protein V8D89_014119 [Ganoderma adspersum]
MFQISGPTPYDSTLRPELSLVELLDPSFKNSQQLNAIIDKKLASGRPQFIQREIVVAGESFEVFYHDKELEKCKPGATIIPIIISSDKTQLMVFSSKTAYPVYLTIGNLPKDVHRKPSRCRQILLAYLSSSHHHITNKAAHCCVVTNMFHHCLLTILKPLIKAGIFRITVTSSDGAVQRRHPIFAMYIGDYPEQLLVTCCKNMTCPKCDIDPGDLGESTDPNWPLRNLENVLAALTEVWNSPTAVTRAYKVAGIKPIVHLFWEKLPFVHIFHSITPDILHQLYQGDVWHLVSWLKVAFGLEELNARFTGKEHADICWFLLGLVTRLPLRSSLSPVCLVRTVHTILDFLYLTQYPAHTLTTLELLHGALRRFHQNKAIFIDLNIQDNWCISKLHLWLFGTMDNYDTQYTKQLHIDFTKNVDCATNHKDKFPQMMLWLEHCKKVLRHKAYIKWHFNSSPLLPLPTKPTMQMKLSKWPSINTLCFQHTASLYGANQLQDALVCFIARYCDPTSTDHLVKQAVWHLVLHFNVVHACPEWKDSLGQTVPAHFDTVLVNNRTGEFSRVEGYRVGRMRLIFKIPERAHEDLFPGVIIPGHLAYVEWYSPFIQPDHIHDLIEVKYIHQSCHLIPVCGSTIARDWTSSIVLDLAKDFYVNPFSDLHIYMSLC